MSLAIYETVSAKLKKTLLNFRLDDVQFILCILMYSTEKTGGERSRMGRIYNCVEDWFQGEIRFSKARERKKEYSFCFSLTLINKTMDENDLVVFEVFML